MTSGNPNAISPGFQYEAKTTFLSTTKTLPTFTLGAKRDEKGKSGLLNTSATPINVGPDSYTPHFGTVSHIKSVPKIGFGSSLRFPSMGNARRPHETFYQYTSLGCQVASAKLSEYRYSVGKNERGGNLTGVATARILKVPLPHAVY
jgi:hypothetical protein